MRLYHLLGRLLSPIAMICFTFHQYLFRTPRARVLVWDEQGRLLLIRDWVGDQHWGLPGGGVERNEQPNETARRELSEETGISSPLDTFSYLTTIQYKYQAPIYSVTVESNQLPAKLHNPYEITATKWFTREDLPTDISPLVSLALSELSKKE